MMLPAAESFVTPLVVSWVGLAVLGGLKFLVSVNFALRYYIR